MVLIEGLKINIQFSCCYLNMLQKKSIRYRPDSAGSTFLILSVLKSKLTKSNRCFNINNISAANAYGCLHDKKLHQSLNKNTTIRTTNNTEVE